MLRRMRDAIVGGGAGALLVMVLLGTVWTEPPTLSDRHLVTTSNWNTYVVNNSKHIKETLQTFAGFFSGLHLRTDPDTATATSKVRLIHADRIILNDGTGIADVGPYTADITASGAGGLDTGSESANHWYEIYVIRKSTDGVTNLMLHKANAFDGGSNGGFAASATDGTTALRDASARTKVAQSFQLAAALPGSGGTVGYVELKLAKVGSPTGQLWVTLETNSAGNPSGSAFATSDKIDVSKISATAHTLLVPVRSVTSEMAASTTYHLVAQGDFAITGADYVTIGTKSGNPYANGALNVYNGSAWGSGGTADAYFAVGVLVTYPLTLPSGYDQYQMIGYVYNDGSSNFDPFVAYDRHVQPLDPALIMNADAPNNPTIEYMSAYIPPVPVKVSLRCYTAGTVTMRFGPVPDGYSSGNGPRQGGQVIWYGTDDEGETGPISTEMQAIYLSTNPANTGSMHVGAWEWLRNSIN